MDDITSMISQVLSDPQRMQQIQEMAASLGLGGQGEGQQVPSPPPQNSGVDLSALSGLLGGGDGQNHPPPQQSGGLDLSALISSLGGGAASQPPAQPVPAPGQNGGVDLSALSGMLGGLLGGGAQQSSGTAEGGGVSALASLLGGGDAAQPAASGMPFDIGTLLKLQKAMSGITGNQANVRLLMSLKPRLKPERAKKVDDAVKVMQLIQFLPLIKESGLFGGLDGVLGGGINDILGNLLGGGGRR